MTMQGAANNTDPAEKKIAFKKGRRSSLSNTMMGDMYSATSNANKGQIYGNMALEYDALQIGSNTEHTKNSFI